MKGLRGVKAVERHILPDDIGGVAPPAANLRFLLGRLDERPLRCGRSLWSRLRRLGRGGLVLHDERLGRNAPGLAPDGGALCGRRHDECAVLRAHLIGADRDGAAGVHFHEKREAAGVENLFPVKTKTDGAVAAVASELEVLDLRRPVHAFSQIRGGRRHAHEKR